MNFQFVLDVQLRRSPVGDVVVEADSSSELLSQDSSIIPSSLLILFSTKHAQDRRRSMERQGSPVQMN